MNPLRCLRQVVLAGLFFLLGGCVTGYFHPQRTTLAADRVKLPTQERNGYLWVEARINGAGPFILLVDSGCTTMLLPQRVVDAARLKILPNEEFTVINAADNKLPGKVTWVPALECGGLALRGFFATVISDESFAAVDALSGRRFDGAIGMETLKDVVLEMDFPGKQVTVVKPEAAHYPEERGIGYHEVVPRVAMDVSGKAVEALVDTGANGGIELPSLEGLPLLFPPMKSIGAGAVFGKTSGKRGEISQLDGDAHMGPVTFQNPLLSGMGHQSAHGRLGVTALGNWTLAFNQRTKRIYFLNSDLTRHWPKMPPPDRRFTIGFFAEIEGTGLRLSEVDDGGAADLAGLRPGDLILEIDDLPAATTWGKGPRPKLRVRRDGAEFETRLVTEPNYSPRRTILAADRVVLPTSASRGALLVEARVNDAGPFRFLVTSGGRTLAVGSRVIDAAGLQSVPDWPAPSRGSIARVVWVDRFVAGGLELRGLVATRAPENSLAALNVAHGQVDGFLGMEALKDLVLEFDVAGRKLSAIRPGAEHFPEERAVVYLPNRELPWVTLDVEGHEQAALIDTGSTGGFDLPLLDTAPLLSSKTKGDGIDLSGSGERTEHGQLDGSIRLGPVSWVNPPIRGKKTPRVGTSALTPWKLVFDPVARKVYFLGGPVERKAREIKPAAMSQFRPGYYAQLEESGLRLVEVDPGGAFATAGLREGDLILSVEGMPAVEFAHRVGAFTVNKQHPQKLRVRRDAAEFEATLLLAPEAPVE